VANHLERAALPASPKRIASKLRGAAGLMKLMRQDKKAQAGRLTFILARSIGGAFIAKDVEEKAVMNFLEQELSSP
jgi:3-dehydroquinate synthetase